MKIFKIFFKIIVSVSLLCGMFYIAGPAAIIESIAETKISYLFLSFIIILLSTVIAAYRWFTVMRILDFKGSFWFYIQSYFKGVFFNQFLPSSIGGDAVRVLNVASLGYKKRYAFVGVLIDRGLGVAGIFVINIIFNNFFPSLLPKEIYSILNMISFFGIAGFIGFIFIYKIPFFNKYKWFKGLYAASNALKDVLSSPLRILIQLILTVSVHSFTFIGAYFIALSLGVDISLPMFMIIMPPVILLTIVPISLAGWGIREGAMVGFLGFASVSKNVAVAISVLYGLNYVVQGVAGLYFQLKTPKV